MKVRSETLRDCERAGKGDVYMVALLKRILGILPTPTETPAEKRLSLLCPECTLVKLTKVSYVNGRYIVEDEKHG